jgi:hypothetical protein
MRPAATSLVLACASACALGAAACGDDLALRVVVHHPEDAGVVRTVVSIYESSSTTCAQIELGDLSAAELAAILVTEQTLTGAEPGALDGISRVDRKLVVARGFDAMGRLAAAGCTEKEVISGRDVVEVETDFAVTLSIGAVSPDDPALPIAFTDALGRSREKHRISWRVYGPHGAAPGTSSAAVVPGVDGSWELAQPTCTNSSGVAKLHPVPPAKVGGYAIELRPSWATKPNPILTSFTRLDPTLALIEPSMNVTRPCAIRVAGTTRRLVCLQLTGAVGTPLVAREYEVAVTGGSARLIQRGVAQPATNAVALYSVPRGADRDVYAVTGNGQVLGMFGPGMAPDPSPHVSGATVTDAMLLPSCEMGQTAQLLLRVVIPMVGRRIQVMTPLGSTPADYHGVATDLLSGLALRGTGCVTELRRNSTEAKRRQAALVDVTRRISPTEPRGTTSVVFECDAMVPAKCTATLPVSLTGAGLSAPTAAGAAAPAPGEEPQVTGMSFDATGVVMSSWVLLPNGNNDEYLLVERGRVPAAAVPNLVATGDFDGDGRADLFWDLPNLNQSVSSFQATYGRTIGEVRLSALSAPAPLLVDDLLAGDLTGDGLDDLAMVVRQRREDDLGNVTITTGIVVIPMNTAAPNPDSMFDKPCP